MVFRVGFPGTFSVSGEVNDKAGGTFSNFERDKGFLRPEVVSRSDGSAGASFVALLASRNFFLLSIFFSFFLSFLVGNVLV